jgi:streptogramin lyase
MSAKGRTLRWPSWPLHRSRPARYRERTKLFLEPLEDRTLLAASLISVATSPNPSVIGQGVTVTASVSPVSSAIGIPSGTVTFFDNGSSIGAGTLMAPAPSIDAQFPTPSGGNPVNITTGPDGNLWFTEPSDSKIGQITTSGAIIEFAAPNSQMSLGGIASGPDGNLWFTEPDNHAIGRITTSGTVTEFPLDSGQSPEDITAGPDGNIWFTQDAGNGIDHFMSIGRITTSGSVTEFNLPTNLGGPFGITAGPDGNLWFVEEQGNQIGRITTSGTITEFPLPTTGVLPVDMAVGPDGNLWFTEYNGNQIGRFTTSGSITEFPIPTAASGPNGITQGPDGNLWFVEAKANQIGRITVSGAVTEMPVPAGSTLARGITTGPDSNLWFPEYNTGEIARLRLNPAVATLTTLSPIPVGSDTITATYGGDANFTSSTSSGVVQTVNKADTSTTLTSSANPVVLGQPVTFTAVVKAFGHQLGGTVTFMDGATTLGTANVSFFFRDARFTTSSLGIGSHAITATYPASEELNSSASAAITQTVTQASTTTTLASSPNPATTGQAVTFTATVSAAVTGVGTPTGTVTFLDGASTLGTSSLNSGSAFLSTSFLVIGNHAITASYAGGANFTGSASPAIRQTINGVHPYPAVAINDPPFNSYVGQVYQDLLGRQAADAEIAGWSNFLDNGSPRLQFVQAVAGSAEYRSIVVESLFEKYLGRQPSVGETAAYAVALASGARVEDIAATLAGSGEYFQTRGGGTLDGFLDVLYLDGLGRPIDAGTQVASRNLLAAGVPQAQLASQISTVLNTTPMPSTAITNGIFSAPRIAAA